MLQAINTKLLIAIFAALAAISAYLVHEHNASEKAAAEAAKATAILRQQEAERKAEADAHRREEEAELQKAQEEKQKHSSNNKATHKTWQTYIP
jgi:FtsZ-binding cell division protein ZapB